MRLPVPSKSDFEMTACPKWRVDGSLAKTLVLTLTSVQWPRASGNRMSSQLSVSLFLPSCPYPVAADSVFLSHSCSLLLLLSTPYLTLLSSFRQGFIVASFWSYLYDAACDCYPAGTIHRPTEEIISCHSQTGQCTCQPNVVGRKCDTCQDGYWHIDRATGRALSYLSLQASISHTRLTCQASS